MIETLPYGTHLRELRESFPMNTNKAGFRFSFQNSLHPCALDESSLSIGRFKLPMNILRIKCLDWI